MTQIERITEMENCLDASSAAVAKLAEALGEYEAIWKQYKKLSDYYGSVRWMKDFEDDERGKIPQNLKRGVLSEDAVYDLITENRELVVRMMNLCTKAVENGLV